jgi:hypothetical protein
LSGATDARIEHFSYDPPMKIPTILLYLTLGFLFVTPQTPTTNTTEFTGYRGIKIGMTTDEVRGKVDGIQKGDDQDSLFLSDKESAQIYYDKDGKVMAISVDYFNTTNAPAPEKVLGEVLQAKDDGSMYQLKRYPEKGYWISYNRTAAAKPIITITMQKM